jgi:hypothetical protein
MKERFLKSKKLQGIGGAVLAAIILLIVFLVGPLIARGGPTAELSEGGATVGGGFGIHQGGFYE